MRKGAADSDGNGTYGLPLLGNNGGGKPFPWMSGERAGLRCPWCRSIIPPV